MRPTAPVAPTMAIVSNTAKNLPAGGGDRWNARTGAAAYRFALDRWSKLRSIGDPRGANNVRASR